MKRVYKAKLDQVSLIKLAHKLYDLADEIDECTNNTVGYLAVAAAAEAEKAYGTDASVVRLQDRNIALVAASAEDIYVQEFGAGYATFTDHPLADEADVEIDLGSWSYQNFIMGVRGGGQFWKNNLFNPGEGFWYHNREKFQYITPKMGMLKAWNYIREHYKEFAKEVWRQ